MNHEKKRIKHLGATDMSEVRFTMYEQKINSGNACCCCCCCSVQTLLPSSLL